MLRRGVLYSVLAVILLVAILAAATWLRSLVTPAVSEQAAVSLAFKKVTQEHPGLAGFTLVYDHYEPAPWSVRDRQGNVRYSESKSGCPLWMVELPAWLCPPAPAWVVELTAPPQGPWAHYEALLLIDARTGSIREESFDSSN